MNCKTYKSLNFKRRLGFNFHDVINTKQQTIIRLIKDAFKGINMLCEYNNVLGYITGLHFHDYKLVIEIDDWS